MKHWKLVLGIMISAVCLWIALRGLDVRTFWQTLRGANYWWLLPGIAVYFVAVWARAWRWHYMLRYVVNVPVRRLFPVVVIGYMGNNVYPARAGEVLRSYVLKRREGVPLSTSLTTVILERLFDGLVMLLFVFLALPFAQLPAGYRDLVVAFSALFFSALLVFLALASNPSRMQQLYAWCVERFVPAAMRPRVHGIFGRFIDGLQSLRSPRDLSLIFLSSTLIWLTETTKYWFVMHAFSFSVPFVVLMLMTAVVNLFTTLPSTPGYVGTFHAPGIAILVAFGVSQAIATSYTVVLHGALWLPITALGAFLMLADRMGWRDFGRAVEDRGSAQATP